MYKGNVNLQSVYTFHVHFRTKDPTSVLLNLSKAVYPIGDRIKLDVEVFNPQKRKVKNIQVILEINQPFLISNPGGSKNFRVFLWSSF